MRRTADAGCGVGDNAGRADVAARELGERGARVEATVAGQGRSRAVVAAGGPGAEGVAAGVTRGGEARVRGGERVNVGAQRVGGRGGGKPEMAGAGGRDAGGLPKAGASVEGGGGERA